MVNALVVRAVVEFVLVEVAQKRRNVGKTGPQPQEAFWWYLSPTGMNREDAAKRGVQALEGALQSQTELTASAQA